MDIPPLLVEAVGGAAAVLTTLCWLPQALRVIRLRDTRAISLASYLAFAAGVALWLIYGVLLGKVPLIAANAVTLSLLVVILRLKLRYG
jgi:MtN3 and saliva related transmembrane protein